MPAEGSIPKKLCFVTIGATAAFDALVRACLQPQFLEALSTAGYTDLLVQYGKDGKALFKGLVEQNVSASSSDISVTGFGLNKKGLGQEMRAVKGEVGSVQGVVISHAGSGSILDALRIGVPLIVVPNSTLLDNHQTELAEALATQGYVVHGKLDNLSAALEESEQLRKKDNEWPPVNSGQHRRARGLAGVMDEEMGFLD